MQVPERQHFLVTWAHWGWINHMPIDMAEAEWPTLIVTVVRGQKAPRGLPHLHQNWTDVQAASDTRPDPPYTLIPTRSTSPPPVLMFMFFVMNIRKRGLNQTQFCIISLQFYREEFASDTFLLFYNNAKQTHKWNTHQLFLLISKMTRLKLKQKENVLTCVYTYCTWRHLPNSTTSFNRLPKSDTERFPWRLWHNTNNIKTMKMFMNTFWWQSQVISDFTTTHVLH